jgi:hypothetical protein
LITHADIQQQGLLAIVRTTLIFLPLAWRWRLFERYPKAVRIALLPVVCFLCVVGLGLNQSPKTARWRLLLMTEREEIEWAEKRWGSSAALHVHQAEDSCR